MENRSIEAGKWFHFIGIAGVGMGGLAKILQLSGCKVSGSDLQENAITADLRNLGVTVYIGQSAEHIVPEMNTVVISSAIPDSNPELQEARKQEIPVIRRGTLLAEMVNQKKGIAIAGSHGKTTSTAMVYEIFKHSELDPSLMVGGEICGSHVRAAAGTSPYFITEADESDGSFLEIKPFVALITNVEDDHLDYYGSMEHLRQAFSDFVEEITIGGFACLCSENPILKQIAGETWTRTITYGTEETDDYQMRAYEPYGVGSRFQVFSPLEDDTIGEVILRVPGRHNAMNALGAFAVAAELGVPVERIMEALENFQGTKRRFEIVDICNEIAVVDDYAHHPTEIKATLKAARDVYEGRIVAVFQPHRYSRTQRLQAEFGDAFHHADVVIILDVYSAGEKPIPGVDGSLIFEAVSQEQQNVLYIPQKEEASVWLMQNLVPGDMLLTLGAGDVWKLGREWLKSYQK